MAALKALYSHGKIVKLDIRQEPNSLQVLPQGRHPTMPRDKKERTKKKWIEAKGESIQPNSGNGCTYGGRKEQKTEGRIKERNKTA